MLKAVIIDSSAVARGLLNTVLMDGSYDVVGQGHTAASANVLMVKHQAQIVCISRDVVEADEAAIAELRRNWPKAMLFMVSSEFDAPTVQKAHAMGFIGFIVKPFNAGTVLKTIRSTIIATVKRQQKAQADMQAAAGDAPQAGAAE
ncbi:response regulator [Pseudoduganella ginsengisoli]|uniref:Response regulator n=1 Tax=Pseudoduganella ginsengisoli TaxID=1462440 RepID=A0A6L6PUT1_9BURK|nr:response regulator [Pseudoduganella ginsengisoli]MTW01293.1 response regulator [Pseudoduganella ginsengisoli]